MGNPVTKLVNSEVSEQTIKDTFGIDVSTLRPGCVLILMDVDGPMAFQASGEEVPEEKREAFASLAAIAMAFTERVIQDDEEFCQDLADWAMENIPDSSFSSEVEDEDAEEADHDEAVNGSDWLNADMDQPVPPKKLLH